jgi:phosphoribosylanthranilate isomerase
MKIKVCGITSVEQLNELQDIGVDYAGFIFYEKSPRFVGSHLLTGDHVKKAGLSVNKVGVFVNADEAQILKMVDEWGLDVVQLHGEESPVFCEKISNHVKTIKAFRVNDQELLSYKIAPYENVVDFFLFDAMGEQYGGTGNQFNWEVIADSNISKPFFLSGGIGPSDISSIISFVGKGINCFAVDVNSKFELQPGKKDMNMVKSFYGSIIKSMIR